MEYNHYSFLPEKSVEDSVKEKNWYSALCSENYEEFIGEIHRNYPTQNALLQELPNILVSANKIVCNKNFRNNPLKESVPVFLQHRINLLLLCCFSDEGLIKAKEIFLDLYKSQDFNKNDWKQVYDFLFYK